ncbi:MAG TPA: trigger factor [Tianweitania sediminis]|jgi:trigger factor|nr:trigger factor [Tianweitania sediminis]
MQVTETLNEGLKREIKVVVPASDMEARLSGRLTEAQGKARINGFRPGKVPLQHLRKMYGKSFMAEVVNEILSDSTRSILADRGEKAAMQPEVAMTENEGEADKILAGQADFEFSLNYEVIPAIEVKDYSDIAVTRPVYDVTDEEIDEGLQRVAESARTYETKDGAAEDGDRVTIDYLGKVDGEAFQGGQDSDAQLVLGSKQFIPGFEEQLVGLKAGDEKVITVTFPAQYNASHLAGKEATFDITVKEVAAPNKMEVTDEVAKNLGIESLERLREIVKGQLENQYGQMTRQKVKRELLDALDGSYQFEAPSKLVDAEYENIWNQVQRDLQAAGQTFEDEGTTEEAAQADYRKLAERRVRLGLVLAEIGEKAGVTVSDEEMQRALFDFVRRYPGPQQQDVFDFYRKNPSALASIRAPLYEEKVVDHLLGQIKVTDKSVSKEELMAEDEGQNSEATASEEEKKPAKKKAAPKKKAAKSEETAAEQDAADIEG